MSNALLEALSYGVPCVVSDIAPNRGLVDHGVNGLRFSQGNAEDLARQLEVLAKDRQNGATLGVRFGDCARERIRSRYSSQVIGEKLSEIYRDVSLLNIGQEVRA
jgi:glycosyltransferase involved in cell wall biosynthesis